MKSNAKPSLYFSAYPLKTITQSSSANGTSPYLKAILSSKTKPTMLRPRVKVFPMVNPYKTSKAYKPVSKVASQPEEKKLNENGWYNNYE